MAVTYPTIIYGQDSSVETNPRLIRNKFGDGNQAVIVDGINSLDKAITLVHPLLESSEASTIRTFLETNVGAVIQIINYMQDYTGATTMNIIVTGWSENFDGVTYTFSVKGEKVYRST